MLDVVGGMGMFGSDEFIEAVEKMKREIEEHLGKSKDYDITLPRVIHLLSEDENLRARDEKGRLYKYDGGLIEVNEDMDGNGGWLPTLKPNLTKDFMLTMFKIEHSEDIGEWIEIDGFEILSIINSDDHSAKLRICTATDEKIDMSFSLIMMLSVREILDYDWERLVAE